MARVTVTRAAWVLLGTGTSYDYLAQNVSAYDPDGNKQNDGVDIFTIYAAALPATSVKSGYVLKPGQSQQRLGTFNLYGRAIGNSQADVEVITATA